MKKTFEEKKTKVPTLTFNIKNETNKKLHLLIVTKNLKKNVPQEKKSFEDDKNILVKITQEDLDIDKMKLIELYNSECLYICDSEHKFTDHKKFEKELFKHMDDVIVRIIFEYKNSNNFGPESIISSAGTSHGNYSILNGEEISNLQTMIFRNKTS